MRVKSLNTLLVAIILASVGCSREASIEPISQLKVEVTEFSLQSKSSSLLPSGIPAIGVIALNVETSESDYPVDNQVVQFTNNSGNIALTSQQAYIYSFSPCTGTESYSLDQKIPTIELPSNVFPLSVSYSNNDLTDNILSNINYDNDYMYGVAHANQQFTSSVPRVNSTSPKASIGLKHIFSQIRFKIKLANSYTKPGTITNLKLHRGINLLFGQTPPEGTASTTKSSVNLLSGDIVSSASEAPIAYDFAFSGISLNGLTGKTLEIHTLATPKLGKQGSNEIHLTIDNKSVQTTNLKYIEWNPGTYYTYSLELTQTGLTLENIVIQEWVEGEIITTTIPL